MSAWGSALRRAAIVTACSAALASFGAESRPRLGATELVFATRAEAMELAGADDEFFRAMSEYDRMMRAGDFCSGEQFAEIARAAMADWTPEERGRVTAAVSWLSKQLASRRMALPLPARVMLVKTTGKEEGSNGYTRGSAVFFAPVMLRDSTKKLASTIAHELFHVASRTMPADRRAALYRLAGFHRIDGFELPPELEARRITNPDGVDLSYAVQLKSGDWVAPVLQGSVDRLPKGGTFFSHLVLELLVLERADGAWRAKRDGAGRLLLRREDDEYREATRSKTSYRIHADEILASNLEVALVAPPELTAGLPDEIAAALK